MKIFIISILFLFLFGCSFDNKSGIWKNENKVVKKKENPFVDFKNLTSTDETFDKIILYQNDQDLKLSEINNNKNWTDVYFNNNNNYGNFSYTNLNNLIFKSKRISRSNINKEILFENGNVILSDQKGNIIIFSLNQNKILSKFNFYKKRFRQIEKKLNLVVENNIIYVSDNIGFLYAYDYIKQKIVWAKNYKIPFQSNIKIYQEKILTSNQNNNFYFLNKKNGEVLRLIPTEETFVKNRFINNLSISQHNSFFLNTYGSLYSFDNKSMKVNWFINLNRSTDINPSNLFMSNQIITNEKLIIVSSNDYLYVLDKNNGSTIFKQNFPSKIKPIISNNYLFSLSKKDLLILMSLKDGKIIYSYDVNQKIADYYETKKKKAEFQSILIADNKTFVFLKNSFVLKFNKNGSLSNIKKLPSKINSNPIFVNSSLIFIDKKNKISVIN